MYEGCCGSPEECREKRVRYFFGATRREKIEKNLVSVEESTVEAAVQGAGYFRDLECSQELWMTAEEWRAVRLRILKERVLFYI